MPATRRASRSRRDCNWPSSSGTADRTRTGIRRLRRSQIAWPSRSTARSRSRRPWRLRTRRKRSTRLEARPSKIWSSMRSFSADGTRPEPENLGEAGERLEDVRLDLGELVERRPGPTFFLGRVDEGFGIAPGDGNRLVVQRGFLRSWRRSCWRSCGMPLLSVSPGGQLLNRRVEQPAMIVVGELLGQHATGDRDGHLGRLLPDLSQRLVACRHDLSLGPQPGRVGLLLRLLDNLVGCRLRVLAAPSRSGPEPRRPRGPSACDARPSSSRSRSAPARCPGGPSRGGSHACAGLRAGDSRRTCGGAGSSPTKTTRVQIARVGSTFSGLGDPAEEPCSPAGAAPGHGRRAQAACSIRLVRFLGGQPVARDSEATRQPTPQP